MGLPETFVPQDWSALARAMRDIAALAPIRLAGIAEGEGEPFARRYAAGLLLAMVGDPRIDGDAPAMCRVAGGTYRVGVAPAAIDGIVAAFAPLGVQRGWIEKEAPAHAVTLAAFAIGRYPVTNREYAEFLAETGDLPLPSTWRFGTVAPGEGNQPVHGIVPDSADAYARWRSARTGRCFRLPSEAEWEVAAGAGRRVYPWGDVFAPDRANTLEAGILRPTPVGLFPRGVSPWGCLDMAGNVEEFVADRYRPYPGSAAADDDLSRADPTYRVARGGSFTRYRDLARCARRHGAFPSPLYAIGFRLAETLAEAAR